MRKSMLSWVWRRLSSRTTSRARTRVCCAGCTTNYSKPQGKLVSVLAGAVFDVAVDIRRGSPELWSTGSVSNSVPTTIASYMCRPGFAHGFCVLSSSADFYYKCTDYYAPQYEHGILWNDPDIGIEWPGSDFAVSDKDRNNQTLAQLGDRLPVYLGAVS